MNILIEWSLKESLSGAKDATLTYKVSVVDDFDDPEERVLLRVHRWEGRAVRGAGGTMVPDGLPNLRSVKKKMRPLIAHTFMSCIADTYASMGHHVKLTRVK